MTTRTNHKYQLFTTTSLPVRRRREAVPVDTYLVAALTALTLVLAVVEFSFNA